MHNLSRRNLPHRGHRKWQPDWQSEQDFLSGGGGDDTVLGGGGADSLASDDGFDVLYGGAGADLINILAAHLPHIEIFGGAGIDTLQFAHEIAPASVAGFSYDPSMQIERIA